MRTTGPARTILGVVVIIGAMACATHRDVSAQGVPEPKPEAPQRVEIVEVPPSLKPSDTGLLIATTLGVVSALIAIVGAVEFAKRSRVDTFRALRESFFKLRTDPALGLPLHWATADLDTPLDAAAFEGLKRYWLNAFDEWFITSYHSPLLYKSLWTHYYKNVLQRAAKRPLMLVALSSAYQSSARSKADAAFLKAMFALAEKPVCDKLQGDFKNWVERDFDKQGGGKEKVGTTLAAGLHLTDASLKTLLETYAPKK
jgi:hypothetical protein